MELSKVLEVDNYLTKAALYDACNGTTESSIMWTQDCDEETKTDQSELARVVKCYYQMLEECNVLDERTLLSFLEGNEKQDFYERAAKDIFQKSLLFIGVPHCKIQV